MGSTWEDWQRQTAGYPETDKVRQRWREQGKTWNELRWLAEDPPGWRNFADAFCSTGSEED